MPPEDQHQKVMVPPDLVGKHTSELVVNANDPIGVEIVGLQEGDVIKIDSILGWCTFSDGTPLSNTLGAISKAATLVNGIVPHPAAKVVLDAAKKAGNLLESEPKAGKARNGFGRIRKSGDFARKEGGIIVCMPGSGGPIHAHERSYLDERAEKEGRIPKYVAPSFRDWCFFPCRPGIPGGIRKMVAKDDGSAWILAFDADHKDNDGVYVVRLRVTRRRRND